MNDTHDFETLFVCKIFCPHIGAHSSSPAMIFAATAQ